MTRSRSQISRFRFYFKFLPKSFDSISSILFILILNLSQFNNRIPITSHAQEMSGSSSSTSETDYEEYCDDAIITNYACPLRPTSSFLLSNSPSDPMSVCEQPFLPICLKEQEAIDAQKQLSKLQTTTSPTTSFKTTPTLPPTMSPPPPDLEFGFCDEERMRCDMSISPLTTKIVFDTDLIQVKEEVGSGKTADLESDILKTTDFRKSNLKITTTTEVSTEDESSTLENNTNAGNNFNFNNTNTSSTKMEMNENLANNKIKNNEENNTKSGIKIETGHAPLLDFEKIAQTQRDYLKFLANSMKEGLVSSSYRELTDFFRNQNEKHVQDRNRDKNTHFSHFQDKNPNLDAFEMESLVNRLKMKNSNSDSDRFGVHNSNLNSDKFDIENDKSNSDELRIENLNDHIFEESKFHNKKHEFPNLKENKHHRKEVKVPEHLKNKLSEFREHHHKLEAENKVLEKTVLNFRNILERISQPLARARAELLKANARKLKNSNDEKDSEQKKRMKMREFMKYLEYKKNKELGKKSTILHKNHKNSDVNYENEEAKKMLKILEQPGLRILADHFSHLLKNGKRRSKRKISEMLRILAM